MLWFAWNPNWLALSKYFLSMCLWKNFRITFSKRLPVDYNMLIGRRSWGNLGSLLGFGKAIIFFSFQDLGKWESLMQWLNIFVRCTSGLLGSCLGHSFGMPSIPQAFRSFRDSINFCKSHGLILSGGSLSTASRSWTHSGHVMWTAFSRSLQMCS
jgi:hypothetical protein